MKNTNKKDKFSSVIALVCVLAVVVVSCCASMMVGHFRPEVKENVDSFLSSVGAPETTVPPEVTDSVVRFMSVGDNIIHSAIYQQAQQRSETGSYDFSYVYDEVKGILKKSDISMINQETVISGEIAPSGYPSFCSPTELGDAVCDMGFDVVNHANKHIGDKGSDGAQDTLNYWKTKSDVTLIGLYQSANEVSNSIPVKEINGIRFSFIGITENVNSPLPADSMPFVLSLNQAGKTSADVYNQLRTLIKRAETISDVVVVSMHFDGNEKQEPTDVQTDAVNYLVSFGADVIIGSGTNSVQKMEVRENADGTKAVIAYSLGNFVSAQTSKQNMLGAIADIIFKKSSETGEVTVESAKLIPIVTMYERGNANVRIVPLADLDEATVSTHGIYGFNMDYINTYFTETVGAEYLEAKAKGTKELVEGNKVSADNADTTADITE